MAGTLPVVLTLNMLPDFFRVGAVPFSGLANDFLLVARFWHFFRLGGADFHNIGTNPDNRFPLFEFRDVSGLNFSLKVFDKVVRIGDVDIKYDGGANGGQGIYLAFRKLRQELMGQGAGTTRIIDEASQAGTFTSTSVMFVMTVLKFKPPRPAPSPRDRS